MSNASLASASVSTARNSLTSRLRSPAKTPREKLPAATFFSSECHWTYVECSQDERPIAKEADTTLADLLVEKANQLGSAGAIDECLLWLVRALEHAPSNGETEAAIRRGISLWNRQLLVFEGGIAGELAPPLVISPDGKRMAAVCGNSVHVYSTATGELLQPVCLIAGNCEWLGFATSEVLLVGYRSESSWNPTTPATILAWNCQSGALISERSSILPLMFADSGKLVLLYTQQTARLHRADSLEAVGSELTLPSSQTDGPLTVSLSPDGSHCASLIDGRLDIWDTKMGNQVPFPSDDDSFGQTGPVRLVWSSDGTKLGIATRASIFTYDRLNKQEVKLDSSGNLSVVFSHDGSRLGSYNGRALQLWRLANAEPISDPVPAIDSLNSTERRLTLLRDGGETLIADVTQWRITIWDSEGATLLSVPTRPLPQAPASNGRYLWHRGELTDSETGTRIGQLLQPPLASTVISELQFAPTTPHFFTLMTGVGISAFAKSTDRVAIGRWRLPLALDSTPLAGRTVAYSDDGRYILLTAGAQEAGLQLWDVEMQSKKGEPIAFEGMLARRSQRIAAVSPRGDTVALCQQAEGNPPKIYIYTRGLAEPAYEFDFAGERGLTRLVFSPDGNDLLALGIRGAVHCFRFQQDSWRSLGSPLRAPVGNPARTVVFDPSGRTFMVLYGQESQLWNRETGNPVGQLFDRWRFVDSAIYHPNGKFLVTNDIVDSILFETESGSPLSHGPSTTYPENSSLQIAKQQLQPNYPELDDHRPFRILDFDRSGERMATTHGAIDAPFIQIRDARTSQPIGARLRHLADVQAATFSPDGRYLATLSADTLRIWNTGSSEPVGPPRRISGTRLAFSADSRLLATEHQLWHVASGLPLGPSMNLGQCQFVSFTPNGRWVIRIGHDPRGGIPRLDNIPSLHLQEVPEAIAGTVDEIRTRLESMTGRRLDEQGAIWPIDPSEIPPFGM